MVDPARLLSDAAARCALPADIFPPAGPIRGMVLLLHGLNFRTEVLSWPVSLFNRAGWGVVSGPLAGHGSVASRRSISLQRWLEDTAVLGGVAAAPGKPCVVAGFSLGGMLGALAEGVLPSPGLWRGFIGFSPAISLYRRTRLLHLLRFFPGLPVPGLTPAGCRVYRTMPLRAYTALMDGAARLRRAASKLQPFPGLVFADPRDRAVRWKGLCRFCAGAGLYRWQLHPLRVNEYWHHIIVESRFLSHSGVRFLEDELDLFFRCLG